MRFTKINIDGFIVAVCLLLLVSCTNTNHTDNKGKKDDHSEANKGPKDRINIERFDQDLLSFAKDSSINNLHQFRSRYGNFLDTIFCKQIMKIWTPKDEFLVKNILSFINDVDIQKIYLEVNEKFKNMDEEEEEFKDAFTKYKALFPGSLAPRVYTMVNAFNYSVIAIDSAVVVGLELYLGEDCPFYSSLQYPIYKLRKLRREYIVRDAIECWLKSDYDNTLLKHDLVSQMVYNGKILYAINALLPELNDTLKMGYTKKQLDWCKASEGAIWTFFIEKKLLFSTNELQYASFVNDGPTSKGMPKESPANTGSWIGWQVVKKYMKEHPEISLKKLLETKNAQQILNGSKYKPSL